MNNVWGMVKSASREENQKRGKKKIRGGEVGNFLKNKLLDKIARHEDVTCRESFAMNDVTKPLHGLNT